jgi:hypothetical protein
MTLGTFTEFVKAFEKTFKRLDTIANTLNWLATHQVSTKTNGSFDVELYITNFQDKLSLQTPLTMLSLSSTLPQDYHHCL